MTTKTTTTMRRCTGSARFGIEPHEAPIDAFPEQPSQRDGLGRMCKPHWKAYTTGLRKDAQARKEAGTAEAPTEPASGDVAAATPKPKRTTRKTAEGSSTTPSNAAVVEQAEMLIAVVDAMPADQMVKRVGDADVQAALEVSAAARMLAD